MAELRLAASPKSEHEYNRADLLPRALHTYQLLACTPTTLRAHALALSMRAQYETRMTNARGGCYSARALGNLAEAATHMSSAHKPGGSLVLLACNFVALVHFSPHCADGVACY